MRRASEQGNEPGARRDRRRQSRGRGTIRERRTRGRHRRAPQIRRSRHATRLSPGAQPRDRQPRARAKRGQGGRRRQGARPRRSRSRARRSLHPVGPGPRTAARPVDQPVSPARPSRTLVPSSTQPRSPCKKRAPPSTPTITRARSARSVALRPGFRPRSPLWTPRSTHRRTAAAARASARKLQFLQRHRGPGNAVIAAQRRQKDSHEGHEDHEEKHEEAKPVSSSLSNALLS